MDDEDAAAVAERVRRDGLTVLAYRFEDDTWCTGRRFAAYRRSSATPSTAGSFPPGAANRDPPPFFRGVVGLRPQRRHGPSRRPGGHPTIRARDEILALLAQRLGTVADGVRR
ncbi:hypothetical protein [Streptomyces griseosporeus]|uniref:hypothetical protein n=1 Tax=Streptomyces griseosporeus TaxID=1910 RepID=UPI00379DADDD